MTSDGDDGADLPPRLNERIVEHALANGISLQFDGRVWIAEDIATGERASGISIPRAWGSLRGEHPRDVYGEMIAAGVNPHRPTHD